MLMPVASWVNRAGLFPPRRNAAVVLATEESKSDKDPAGLDEATVGSLLGPSDWGVLYAGLPSRDAWRGFTLYRLDKCRNIGRCSLYLLLDTLLNKGSTEHRSPAFSQAEQAAGNFWLALHFT